jgi:hypothetical protein
MGNFQSFTFFFLLLLLKTLSKLRTKTLGHDLKDCVLTVDTDNFDDDLAGSTDGRRNSLFLTQSEPPSISSEPIQTPIPIFEEKISQFPPPQQFTRSKTNNFNNVKDKFKQVDVRNFTLARKFIIYIFLTLFVFGPHEI